MLKKPLLSICIPTYNRAEYLDKCIASIVSQDMFNSDDVELVISDNASTDNTEEIVRKYKERYKNIFYTKNTENVRDKNFPIVIGNAHGAFRKLCNDTLVFSDGTIRYLLEIINQNINKRPVLFFMNLSERKITKKQYITHDFNSFIKKVSFHSTWIGGFGIWEDDFENITAKYDGCSLSLWQTKVLLEMVEQKRAAVIEYRSVFLIQDLRKKDLSYGLYEVFYRNYLGLCQKYLEAHVLSKNVFRYLRKHLLLDFFSVWIINSRTDYNKYIFSPNEKVEQLIQNAYSKDIYKIMFYFRLKFFSLKQYLKNTGRNILD